MKRMRSFWRVWLLGIWLGASLGCATGGYQLPLDQRYASAARALDGQQWELAARSYHSLWRDDNASKGSVVGWSRALLGQGHPESALSILKAARERDEDAELASLTGKTLDVLGRSEEAREAYAAALAQDPQHPGALAALGKSFFQAGHAEAAAPLLLRAAKAADSDPALLRLTAEAAQTAGLAEIELEALEVLSQLGDSNAGELVRGAELLRGQGPLDSEQRARIEAWFSRAVSLDPQLATGWIGLARMRAERGEQGLAVTAYERAVEADPSQAGALLALARLCQEEGRPGRARVLAEHALTFLQGPEERAPFESLLAELDAAIAR